jgi:hypothetical protein
VPDPFGRIRRNLTTELIEGSSDGALKKSRPNWSNVVADETDSARSLLSHVEGGYDWSPSDPSGAEYTRGYVRGA